MSRRKTKFRPGAKITSVALLASLLRQEAWIYLNHKPMHPSFLEGMTLRTLRQYAERGRLREAVPNSEQGTH